MNLSYKKLPLLKFLPEPVKNFIKDSKAVAAVEFAFIAPLLILLFIGSVEVSLLLAIDRKLSRTSSTVADLVTQREDAGTDAEILPIFGATDRIMYPYGDRIPCVVISEILTTNEAPSGAPPRLVSRVQRSLDNSASSPFYTSPDAAQCSVVNTDPNANVRRRRADNSEFLLPEAIQVEGSTIWVAEVEYDHSPIIGFFRTRGASALDVNTDAITLSDRIYLRPRFGN